MNPQVKARLLITFIAAETFLVIGLFAYLILRSPAPTIKTVDDEKQIRDSIQVLMKKYDAIEQDKKVLILRNDSLQKVKSQVKIIYQTQIKYVQTANNNSLDSLIRASW